MNEVEEKIVDISKSLSYPGYFPEYPLRNSFRPILKQLDNENIIMPVKATNELYFHIPFCRNKCSYCSLYSVKLDEHDISTYAKAICKEINLNQDIILENEFDSIYFGGGTPSLLGIKNFDKIFSTLNKYLADLPKLNIETTPDDFDKGLVNDLFALNLKRVSFGIQSFNKNEILLMGRTFNQEKFLKTLHYLKKNNVEVNLDFIYGFPNQKWENIEQNLKHILTLSPDSVFFYPLRLRPNSDFGKKHISLENNTIFKTYDFIKKNLSENGFTQISFMEFHKSPTERFFSDGYKGILGFGAGACSFYENIHFCNELGKRKEEILTFLPMYINSLNRSKTPQRRGIILNRRMKMRRYVILNLRNKGINIKEFKDIFGKEIDSIFPQIKLLKKHGLLCGEIDICLTEKGTKRTENIISLFF